MIRSVARFVRHAPDRALHASRHAAAREAVMASPGGTVLFVCHGNICRSPYAEHALVRDLPDPERERWQAESLGFVKPDRPSPAEARAVTARRGVDLEGHRSRLLTRESVSAARLIYVMSAAQEREIQSRFGADPERVWVLGDLDPEPIRKRTIQDPVDQPESVFETVYDRIDRCIRVIVAETGRSGT
jgi:protein-tyrosine phosphatase